ncbi:hypothetical protein TNIN_108731 [Trichonephila inaurata madagascariensis]|uniref:Uncharacterized protein n=1 Tax=Trichonephila inaurata madagascariensis TaxID=2747483 RepID=A0A8X6X2R3_9ARAC|nr:hypothetical protein TNIN_108731 [Trichonephila inaurata madagascariensis]
MWGWSQGCRSWQWNKLDLEVQMLRRFSRQSESEPSKCVYPTVVGGAFKTGDYSLKEDLCSGRTLCKPSETTANVEELMSREA